MKVHEEMRIIFEGMKINTELNVSSCVHVTKINFCIFQSII